MMKRTLTKEQEATKEQIAALREQLRITATPEARGLLAWSTRKNRRPQGHPAARINYTGGAL